uniref:Uncharacterized protein n=1 Tax=Parascaris univalens TaxID=6257 RepID=A0A915C499_PARUN
MSRSHRPSFPGGNFRCCHLSSSTSFRSSPIRNALFCMLLMIVLCILFFQQTI